SRTAAHTRPRAVRSSVRSTSAHSAGDGPAQAIAWSASRGSTAPPGKTYAPAANARVCFRRSRKVSKGSSRSSTTVAASRAGTTGARPARTSLARSHAAPRRGRRTPASSDPSRPGELTPARGLLVRRDGPGRGPAAGRPRWARPRRARPAEETLGRIRQDPRGAAPRPSPRPPLQERDKRGVVLRVVEVNDCDEFPAGAPPVIEDLLGPTVSAQVEAHHGVLPPRHGPTVKRTAGGAAFPWTTPS